MHIFSEAILVKCPKFCFDVGFEFVGDDFFCEDVCGYYY